MPCSMPFYLTSRQSLISYISNLFLNETLMIFLFVGLKLTLTKSLSLPLSVMKFWVPPMTFLYSTLTITILICGAPHAMARNLPSRESSIWMISREQTFLI